MTYASKINDYLRLIRPKQWVKNFFIAAPLLFGLKLFELSSVTKIVYGFVFFSIAASMVYIINDLCDVKIDRLHPKNKHRPLASNRISLFSALVLLNMMALLLFIFAWIAFFNLAIPVSFYSIMIIYLLINISYSLGFKHIPLFEMFLVASGYVLRVIAGCSLLSVSPSPWIIIVTGVVSMLIIAGKRRAELMACSSETGLRKSISGYNLAFIDSMISMFGTATIITYMLYTISPITHHSTDYLIYTSIFVTYGVARYILLIKVKKETHSPTDLVLSDVGIRWAVILWIISLILIFYR